MMQKKLTLLFLFSLSLAHAGPLKVTAPPGELKLDPFYKKYISAGGYPVVSSEKVNDYALKEAAWIINMMLAQRPDVREEMISNGSRMIVMAYDEFTSEIPEYAHFENPRWWDARARGLGGSEEDPVCSVAEENVLGYPGDPYNTESIVIHEFAHNIHLRGLVNVDPTFNQRLSNTYAKAMSEDLWKNKYASRNIFEYFAEGVQSWFNNNRPPDHDHNHVDTREELKAYDPGLAKICEEAFGETELVYTKPATRLHGHLEGLDLKNAPRFTWPERLNKVRAGIKRAGRNRGCEKLGRSPLKVYILAGQSNMEGHGLIELSDRQVANYRKKGLNEEQIAVKRGGTLKELIRAPKTMYRMAQVADENGEWVWRNDVWMHYERARSGLRNGPHGPGYGARDDRIGPEFQFGHLMGTVHEEQVLIIKTAWGGKSLAVDFRPPSSGKNPYTLNNKKEVFPGAYYRKMIGQVQGVLKNLKQLYPDYDGTGYELAGFCWHQGWNDGANEDFGKEYAANLVNFINDVREDLKAENLPFVIATSGFGGTGKRGGFVGRLQQWVQPAQLAAAEKLDHVVAIDTRPFFRPEEASPGRGDIEHWFSNAESYFLIGEAMAEAMKTLITR